MVLATCVQRQYGVNKYADSEYDIVNYSYVYTVELGYYVPPRESKLVRLIRVYVLRTNRVYST